MLRENITLPRTVILQASNVTRSTQMWHLIIINLFIIIVKMSQLMMCHVMWHSIWIFFNVNIACNAVSSVNYQISITNRNFLSGLDFTPKWLFGMHGNFLEKNTFSVSNHKTYNADRDICWFPVLFFWINSNSETKQNKTHNIFSSDLKQKLQPMVSPTYF